GRRGLHLDLAARAHPAGARRCAAVPDAACLAAGRGAGGRGALLQPARHRAGRALTRMARILVAEDEEALRAFIVRALGQDGHEGGGDGGRRGAAGGAHRRAGAVRPAAHRHPHAVMDGIALALAAARDWPELMILLMTGYADQRERAHGLDALIHDVIAK